MDGDRVILSMYESGKKVAEQEVTEWPVDRVEYLYKISQEFLGREVRMERTERKLWSYSSQS